MKSNIALSLNYGRKMSKQPGIHYHSITSTNFLNPTRNSNVVVDASVMCLAFTNGRHGHLSPCFDPDPCVGEVATTMLVDPLSIGGGGTPHLPTDSSCSKT